MELAGSALAGQSGRTPCIGFASWKMISHRDVLKRRGEERNYRAAPMFLSYLRRNTNISAGAFKLSLAPQSPAQAHVLFVGNEPLNFEHLNLVRSHISNEIGCNRIMRELLLRFGIVRAGKLTANSSKSAALDKNHTHFFLVDNGSDEVLSAALHLLRPCPSASRVAAAFWWACLSANVDRRPSGIGGNAQL
eukprot:3032663-Pleurochrysis_carterae.AAC.1